MRGVFEAPHVIVVALKEAPPYFVLTVGETVSIRPTGTLLCAIDEGRTRRPTRYCRSLKGAPPDFVLTVGETVSIRPGGTLLCAPNEGRI